MTKNLANLLQQATRRQAEATLAELFDTFQLGQDEGTLSKLVLVSTRLSELGLRLVPSIELGNLETVRRVEIIEPLAFTETDVLQDLQLREAEDLELKSSLLYDHDRAKGDPRATIAQLRSESVLYSALRTIAGFLTCSGGRLYVGVDDGGTVLGIEHDFACITEEKQKWNTDQWELHLRNHIQDRFKDGKSINDYVSCAVVSMQGRQVARLEVAPRARLAFLMVKGSCHLYRRQGNRTVEVPIDCVEEFIEFRKSLRD